MSVGLNALAQLIASMGQHGDDRLAFINKKEEKLLKKKGGVGIPHPAMPSVKQYYAAGTGGGGMEDGGGRTERDSDARDSRNNNNSENREARAPSPEMGGGAARQAENTRIDSREFQDYNRDVRSSLQKSNAAVKEESFLETLGSLFGINESRFVNQEGLFDTRYAVGIDPLGMAAGLVGGPLAGAVVGKFNKFGEIEVPLTKAGQDFAASGPLVTRSGQPSSNATGQNNLGAGNGGDRNDNSGDRNPATNPGQQSYGNDDRMGQGGEARPESPLDILLTKGTPKMPNFQFFKMPTFTNLPNEGQQAVTPATIDKDPILKLIESLQKPATKAKGK